MQMSKDVFMDLGTYDTQEDSLTIAEWLMLYEQKTGNRLRSEEHTSELQSLVS